MCNSFDYSVAYNAKSWKHICKRLIKLWYTYIIKYCAALKKKKGNLYELTFLKAQKTVIRGKKQVVGQS